MTKNAIEKTDGVAPTLALPAVPVRAVGDSIGRVLDVMADAEVFASKLANSQFVPQAFRGNPADVMAAVTLGQMIGLNPMQALWGIAVINGRPTIWGDAALAVVRSHPEFEDMSETIEKGESADAGGKATCTIKRRGQSPVVRTFSMEQAKRAGLAGKKGPWTDYPARMLQMRARGFAMRDAFADALFGMITREEAEDYPEEAREPRVVTPSIAPEPGKGRQSVVALPSRRAKTEEAPVVAEPEAAPPAAPQAAAEPEDRRTVAQLRAHALAQLARFEGDSGDADRALFLADFVAGAQDDATRALDSVKAIQACGYTEPLRTLCNALDRAFGASVHDG